MSYLYIGCGTLIVFIISLIAGKKDKALSDYFLGTWLLMLLMNVLTLFLLGQDSSKYSLAERLLFEFSEASVFLHGPLLLLYTLALTRPKFAFKKKYLVHTSLFLGSFWLLIWGILYEGTVNFNIRKWLILIKMLSLLVYTIAAIVQLKKHRISIQNIFSNTEEKQLNWLYFLCWGILIIWFISCISLFLSVFTNITTPEFINLFPNLAVCIFIYLMGYFGVRQNTIFVKNETLNYPTGNVYKLLNPKEEVSNQEEKYKKSGLNKMKSDKIYQELVECMEKQKPYLDADISLFNLAKMLHIQPNHLSQVINETENLIFFDFINGYRIRAIKDQILSGKLEEHTFLGIALDCGFNSKASFNRAFKKHTGLTPTEFKNQNKKDIV